jgi:putative transposase
LKERHSCYPLGNLCLLFDVSRQAYYQHFHTLAQERTEEALILGEVLKIRHSHPRMGGRKLFEKLSIFKAEHKIKMGRDALFNLLAINGLLIKKRRNRMRTTCSFHHYKKYPNLIKNLTLMRVNEVWVSDITYWKTKSGFLYISFITDVYSHKLVGYHLSQTLEAIGCVAALKMALKDYKYDNQQLIHHSDRGSQYCSDEYVKLLKANNIGISMTENGDPLENPLAERVNGIIKNEYLYCYQVEDLAQATDLLDSVVKLYNEDRPHSSISNLTPNQVHHATISLEIKRLWKNYYHPKQPIEA